MQKKSLISTTCLTCFNCCKDSFCLGAQKERTLTPDLNRILILLNAWDKFALFNKWKKSNCVGRKNTHFYSSGSYEIGIQGFGEMERFHLTIVGVQKIVKQFHLSKDLYPNFVATIRIEMGLFPSNAVGYFHLYSYFSFWYYHWSFYRVRYLYHIIII